MHSKQRMVLIAFLLVLAYALVYPRHIELSGDQNAAVVAAQSLLQDGSYKVPLHEAYGPESSVEIGADMRQALKWYPPGYTILLYALVKLGATMAAGALGAFYIAKFIWTLAWLAAGRAWRIPERILIGSVAFSLFLTYPATNTDIYESIGIAFLFLALSERLGEPGSAIVVSAATSAATLFRYSAVKLMGFYGVVEVLRRPRPIAFLKVALAGLAPVGVYLFCTRVIAGDVSPYHGVGPGPHTRWMLLPKGVYYAAIGGWIPTLWPLKLLEMVLLALAVVGFLLVRRKGPVQDWILLVIGFQAYCLGSLIFVQISFGGMYPAFQPAFATPRYIALAQPFSVAALLLLASFALRRAYPVLRAAPALILLAAALNWVTQNRTTMEHMSEGPDGFLRFSDEDALDRMLRAEHLDGVFDGTGVFTYTSVDPRIIYPDDIRSLHSASQARIAVVRIGEQPNELLDDLEKSSATPYLVQRIGRYEVDLFTLPPGFSLAVNSHRGYVPHV